MPGTDASCVHDAEPPDPEADAYVVIACGRGCGAHANSAHPTGSQPGSKRARGDDEAGGDATQRDGSRPPEFTFDVALAPTCPVRVRVRLLATTRGEASSAFWCVAEQVRNDVVRDTRKWKRAARLKES